MKTQFKHVQHLLSLQKAEASKHDVVQTYTIIHFCHSLLNHRYYTSKAHPAGTPNDYEQALWTAEQYRKVGIPNVRIDEYYPLIKQDHSCFLHGA